MSSAIVRRIDAFVNLFTGLGTSRDKSRQTVMCRTVALQPETCESLFQGSDLARRICASIVDQALRQGFDLEHADKGDEAESQKQNDELASIARKWDVRAKVHEGGVWGRTFGGSAIWVGVEDGKQAEPLDEASVKAGSVKFFLVLDRRDLQPRKLYSDPGHPKFGEPETYNLVAVDGRTSTESEIHESRLVFFPGILTTRRARQENQWWDHSALQPVYEILQDTEGNWKSLVALVADFGQGVFKINGLMQMIAAGQEETVRKRMQIVDEGRSSLRSIILDSEHEDFERKATPVAGLPEIMIQTWQRLAAAADMPVTILMGMSPAGLNATGESDIRQWYDRVQHYRETVLTPRIERLMRILAANEGLELDVEVCWPSLWQMTAKEEAELRKLIADTDKVYIDGEVVLPEEVAIERSKGGPPRSTFPNIDMEARQAMLDAETKRAVEKAENPPKPPPALPPGGPVGPGPGGAIVLEEKAEATESDQGQQPPADDDA